jgi:hypothetical protein
MYGDKPHAPLLPFTIPIELYTCLSHETHTTFAAATLGLFLESSNTIQSRTFRTLFDVLLTNTHCRLTVLIATTMATIQLLLGAW